MIKLRPAQEEILKYPGGRMGVSAVPGSGKTWTLSLLAANIITGGKLEAGQEVLIVTLTNSAVDNFKFRVQSFLGDSERESLLPRYVIRTLHSLAHDIVRNNPSKVALSDDFQIVDEQAMDEIRNDVARSWLQGHPYALDDYLRDNKEEDENRRDWIRREQLPKLVGNIAGNFIRFAKNLELTPEKLRERLDNLPIPLPLAEMGYDIYTGYQRALNYRGAVDFDDLIRLALKVLQDDPEYLERLGHRWPYILEDEAQDSNLLQEEILGLLSKFSGNWVRVGDPNQAIFETFTTADPRYLRDFIAQADHPRTLPNSGRSTQSIIDLANYLIEWTQSGHPVEEVQDALGPPPIEPAPPGDPQPNPPDDPQKIHFSMKGYAPQGEILAVADSLESWLPDHQEETVVVLVPRNQRGFQLVDELRRRGIEPVDSLLRSTSATRFAAGALANILQYLSDPKSSAKLSTAFRVWRREDREDEAALERVERVVKLLKTCVHVEDYIKPQPGQNWLEGLEIAIDAPKLHAQLAEFREVVQRWHKLTLLPVDQMILTLAQDLFTERTDLAVAHKLASVLSQAQDDHRDWRLPEFTEELAAVARNERRFLGFSEDDLGFDPEKHKGKPVISTMHKAKGLEWDRVYMLSVNNYDFPSGMEYDQYISERWFIRDNLNLEAEALAQLDAAVSADEFNWYAEGAPTQKARLDYVRERLRLLYVGITRAKKELIITWNTGRRGDQQSAIPFVALSAFWEERNDDTA